MAKDPRFNFYPDNWAGGTKRMTYEQKGAYIELLMLNFYCLSDGQPGFTEREALNTLSNATAYASLWEFLMPKFKKEGDFYCSERLKNEFHKSKTHSEKQSERAKKRVYKSTANTTAYAVADACNGTGIGNGTELKNKKESVENSVPHETDSYDFSQPDIQGDELFFPVDTKMIRDHWQGWKKFRWEQYNLRYGMCGEQAALKQLEGLSEAQIVDTILKAIAGKWQNLYPERNRQHNGPDNTIGKKQQHTSKLAASVAEAYSGVFKRGGNDEGGKPAS